MSASSLTHLLVLCGRRLRFGWGVYDFGGPRHSALPLKRMAELIPDVRLTVAKYRALAVVPASHLVCIG